MCLTTLVASSTSADLAEYADERGNHGRACMSKDDVIADARHIQMEAGGRGRRGAALRRQRVRATIVSLGMALSACGGSASSDPPDLRPSSPVGAQRVLPEGLRVPAGAALQGPVLVQRQTDFHPRAIVTSVMSVTGNPRRVWRSLARQLGRRFPDAQIKAGDLPGCAIDPQETFGCGLELEAQQRATKKTLAASVSLRNPRGDITGDYVLTITTFRYPTVRGRSYPPTKPSRWTRGAFPAPRPARPAPKVGDPLPPDGADAGVLLPGSAMVTQWGDGSVTGGFDVLLKVLPGADAADVGAAYARQSAQGEGKTRVTRSRIGANLVTHYLPPGGAGGYQGDISVIDRPGAGDYIYYSYYND
ncbi:MAG: hypothetical protein WKF48_04620 [Solirubrobacteraceae bacterium]